MFKDTYVFATGIDWRVIFLLMYTVVDRTWKQYLCLEMCHRCVDVFIGPDSV